MIRNRSRLNNNVKFRVGDKSIGVYYARIETEHGQPVANFAACDGYAQEIAQRMVDLINTHGVVVRRRVVMEPPKPPTYMAVEQATQLADRQIKVLKRVAQKKVEQ